MSEQKDFEFLKGTRFLDGISRDAAAVIMDCFDSLQIKAGERFIKQGDPDDRCYIIRKGTCVASVEKQGELHTVGRMHEGDIVGEMAILTGEARSAHVDAETDMQVWGISRDQFDVLVELHPELRMILTEVIADRFNSRKLTAERTIGKYRITDILGQGGFSIVYKGVHAALHMPVAVKMMKHNMAMNADFLSKFHSEAQTIAAFNHENIIKIYDFIEQFRTVFIIMELVEGETIKDMLNREKFLPLQRIIDLLLQICAGMDYAHRHNIIHRDIKSANMYVRSDGQLKILDFGLSAPAGTENVEFLGSVPYMSPEEIEGEPVDQRTDIYSLGITAYEMVTGQRPFPEDDLLALSEMHLREDIPDPAMFRPDVPEDLRRFIFKACARKPAHRYQNVNEVIRTLQPLVNELGVTRRQLAADKKYMTTLHLLYVEEQRLALKQILEEFNEKAEKLGVDFRSADFSDI
ncbi:MAG: protein kinase [Desulfobacterales bacterium]|jgi:serine/threonine protein kinase